MTKIQCDFCTSLDVRWTYPCEDFTIERTFSATGVYADLRQETQKIKLTSSLTGGWAACDTCHALIEANDREGLLKRSAELDPTKRMSLHTKKELIAPLHTEFFAHRTGEPVFSPTTPTKDPTR